MKNEFQTFNFFDSLTGNLHLQLYGDRALALVLTFFDSSKRFLTRTLGCKICIIYFLQNNYVFSLSMDAWGEKLQTYSLK